MMMYRTHCQRILDTVIRANFDEVFRHHFHYFTHPSSFTNVFVKKKKKQPLIKTINQKSNEIFFHVKFMNIFSRYKVSCCTSGRGCRNTWWRSWTRRRQYCWWECATRCCTRPSLTSSCRPCFRRYLTGECRLINFICYSFFTMVGSSANFHFVLT